MEERRLGKGGSKYGGKKLGRTEEEGEGKTNINGRFSVLVSPRRLRLFALSLSLSPSFSSYPGNNF